MQIALRAPSEDGRSVKRGAPLLDGSLIGQGRFLPVRLLDGAGSSIRVDSVGESLGSRRVDWLLIEDGNGNIQFRTTLGHYLSVDPDGSCFVAISPERHEDPKRVSQFREWSNFHLYRVPDFAARSLSPEDSDEGEVVVASSRRKELWILESVHGTFLRTDPSSSKLKCSKAPGFWQAKDNDLGLTCTSDTPPRRVHYRKTWEKQTVEYVQKMHRRYLGFTLGKLSLREALECVKAVQGFPFRVGRASDPGISLRTRCVSSCFNSWVFGSHCLIDPCLDM